MFYCLRKALCVSALVCSGVSTAQTNYYWSDNQKIDLNEDKTSVMIQFKQGVPLDRQINQNSKQIKSLEIHETKGRILIDLVSKSETDLKLLLHELLVNTNQVESAIYGWKLEDGFQVWGTDRVLIKLKKGVNFNQLDQIVNRFNAKLEEEKYGRLKIHVNDVNQVLDFSNALKESGLVEFAHPDFYAKKSHFATPTDPYYVNQFQMHNSNDIDCDAPEAWDISKGSSTIRVAVIDDGVETHPDLPTLNNSLGYTPATNGNGTPNSSGKHGVACAGIIGAAHNGVGVAGIAPNVVLFSVNIFAGGETASDLADAISYAKSNGADVMSNSWGFGSCTYTLSALNSAITDAKNNGRGGKGCVIVFASGNDYYTCVSYPGNNSNVIAVGAITNTGVRSSYSNQGPKLDISAPSNGGTMSVYTTDRVGSNGYSSSNYTSTFGGTSAACPLVSGVAALVLSVNGSLTSSEVQSILETTATDMGTSGFDVQFGHGRVDADDAMLAAQGNPGGGGEDPTCFSGTITLNLTTDNYGSETSWTVTNSSNVVVESGNSYSNNQNYSFNWNLTDGDYTFNIHDDYGDGICCSYGNGSYSIVDGSGAVIASGGSFTSNDASEFCIEGEGGGNPTDPEPCDALDFTQLTINSYGNGQDQGTHVIGSSGELVIQNNAWKSIDFQYTVTANTVIELDFGSTSQGEIHGIGFDSDNEISDNRTFQFFGTQSWGILNYNNYASSLGNWKSYVIPVGQFYTGSFNRLIFACDNDGSGTGNSYYRNVKIYEGSCSASPSLAYDPIEAIQIGKEREMESNFAVRLFPNPTSSELTISSDESINGKIVVTDITGRKVYENDVNNRLSTIAVNEMPNGIYNLTIFHNDGRKETHRFVKQ